MIELELKIAEHLSDDLSASNWCNEAIAIQHSPVLIRHVHANEQNARHKVHALQADASGCIKKLLPLTITCASTSTIRLDDFRLEIALKNLAMVMRRPRIEVTAIMPMRRNEICCDQKRTSIS